MKKITLTLKYNKFEIFKKNTKCIYVKIWITISIKKTCIFKNFKLINNINLIK